MLAEDGPTTINKGMHEIIEGWFAPEESDYVGPLVDADSLTAEQKALLLLLAVEASDDTFSENIKQLEQRLSDKCVNGLSKLNTLACNRITEVPTGAATESREVPAAQLWLQHYLAEDEAYSPHHPFVQSAMHQQACQLIKSCHGESVLKSAQSVINKSVISAFDILTYSLEHPKLFTIEQAAGFIKHWDTAALLAFFDKLLTQQLGDESLVQNMIDCAQQLLSSQAYPGHEVLISIFKRPSLPASEIVFWQSAKDDSSFSAQDYVVKVIEPIKILLSKKVNMLPPLTANDRSAIDTIKRMLNDSKMRDNILSLIGYLPETKYYTLAEVGRLAKLLAQVKLAGTPKKTISLDPVVKIGWLTSLINALLWLLCFRPQPEKTLSTHLLQKICNSGLMSNRQITLIKTLLSTGAQQLMTSRQTSFELLIDSLLHQGVAGESIVEFIQGVVTLCQGKDDENIEAILNRASNLKISSRQGGNSVSSQPPSLDLVASLNSLKTDYPAHSSWCCFGC